MMNLNYLMVHTFSVRYSRLYGVYYEKNIKHYPLFLLYSFTSTGTITNFIIQKKASNCNFTRVMTN